MKFCKTLILATTVLLLLAGSSLGQITIPSEDIPSAPGEVFRYLVLADTTDGIEINIGEEGGNQLWDFDDLTSENIIHDSLFNPMNGPSGELFLNADRGIFSYGLMGLDLGQVYRYEGVEDTAWTVEGLVLDVVVDTITGIPITIPLPLSEPILMSPLPMTYEEEWSLEDSIHYVYEEEESGLEFLIVLEYGGFNGFDAWGTLQYPGGEAECLRMHANLGGVVNVYPILFGVPLPIPVYTQELAMTHAYMWLAPDVGELATVVSFPDSSAEIERAAFVRIKTTETNGSSETDVTIPSDFSLSPAWPNPFNASTRFSYSLTKNQVVNVSVFDVMGRQIQTLEHGKMAAGTHSLNWNANRLPSGSYYIRVSTAGQVLSQKVVLIK